MPHFDAKTIAEIKEAHAELATNSSTPEVSTITTAEAYQLLKAILNTAVDTG
jgi:hypothetical protein